MLFYSAEFANMREVMSIHVKSCCIVSEVDYKQVVNDKEEQKEQPIKRAPGEVVHRA